MQFKRGVMNVKDGILEDNRPFLPLSFHDENGQNLVNIRLGDAKTESLRNSFASIRVDSLPEIHDLTNRYEIEGSNSGNALFAIVLIPYQF